MGRKRKHGTQIDRAVEIVIKEDYISWPFISSKLQIGYLGAQKVIKQLEDMGYIEKEQERTKRKVLKHKYIQ